MDSAGLHLCRRRARLPVRHALPAPRRRGRARNRGTLPRTEGPRRHARLLRVPAADGGRGLRVLPRADIGADVRHATCRLGVCHLRLLHPGHDAAHRQSHRTHLSPLCLFPYLHGRSPYGGALHQDAPTARTLERAAQHGHGCRPRFHRANLPLPLHHDCLRCVERFPRHAKPAHGAVHRQRAARPRRVLRRNDYRRPRSIGMGHGGNVFLLQRTRKRLRAD